MLVCRVFFLFRKFFLHDFFVRLQLFIEIGVARFQYLPGGIVASVQYRILSFGRYLALYR